MEYTNLGNVCATSNCGGDQGESTTGCDAVRQKII